MMVPCARERDGFSIVELIVAVVILTTGLLALASTLAYLVIDVRVAELRTARSTAVEYAVEQLRATPYDDISGKSRTDAEKLGEFHVWWDVAAPTQHLREIEIFTAGPGYVQGQGWVPVRQDTLSISLARMD